MGQTQQPTILIVDDQQAELKALRTFLHDRGLQISVATGGEQALTLVKQHPPDLILLDVLMPNMDGFETCRCLKADKNTKDIPVIFMTAPGDTIDKVHGFKLGGVDYIAKPCQQEEVLARVNTHLNIRELQQRYQYLTEAAFEGILLHHSGKILEANSVALRLFGYQRAELIGTDLKQLFAPYTSEHALEHLQHEDQPPYETTGCKKDGALFPLELQSKPLPWQGDVVQVVAVRDLSWKQEQEQLQRENRTLRATLRDRYKFGDIIGKSAVMQAVYEQIVKAASSGVNVLISGESGTGKELAAQTIRMLSERRDCPFVPVNCGAVAENLFEREFFGHRKGAFTGADSDKPGYFAQAHKGILFLDEVGELSPAMQVKLLRVIQSGEYMPLGDNKLKQTDMRIIAATNKDIKEIVRKRLMREDFFYRIHVFVIHLPPLRERREDIPLLIEHFLQQWGGKTSCAFIPANIMDALRRYDWPGNVRELQNELQRYLDGQSLEFVGKDLLPEIDRPPLERSLSITLERMTLQDARAAFEQEFIRAALQKNAWRRGDTAEKLGISPKALYNKIQKYGLEHGK